jgi:ATP citrate (pro-S)-lyase
MIDVSELRKTTGAVVVLGSHPGIIQSMLDYDYLIGKKPSIIAIVAAGRRQERYFWGEGEITIPVVSSIDLLDSEVIRKCKYILNVQSARRVFSSTKQVLGTFKNLKLVSIFAEQTPELHTLELIVLAKKQNVLIIGPSSVGVLIPGSLKLGAIGGTGHEQISSAKILDGGDVAVVSTSGGIVNELIHTVTRVGLGVSFAVALGGDRYPILSPLEAILLAQNDRATKRIVFFGELGGTDEYEIAEHIKSGAITKEVIVYIAGTVAELFESPPQFGHAKSFAKHQRESATAKKDILRAAGAVVCHTFADVENELLLRLKNTRVARIQTIGNRQKAMMISHLSGEKNGKTYLLGAPLLDTVKNNSVASLLVSMLLGEQVSSKKLIEFIELAFKLLVDHGPYVSGAANTIISARAGKDLVSSLTSGLMTIGPRFGGAINATSAELIRAIADDVSVQDFVESFAFIGKPIPGIGHKKYTIDNPDPRVTSLLKFSKNKNGDRYLKFALSIADITLAKKSNLILNVDGAIAAVLLDILESELEYSEQQLRELVDIEFFNAIFVLSRSIGFASHYLDQRRYDEGLFRLSEDDVRYLG